MPTLKSSASESSFTEIDRFKINLQDADWSPHRRFIARVIGQRWFEVSFGVLVLMSLGLAILETDYNAAGDTTPSWAKTTEHVLLVMYCVEMSLRLFVFRKEYFSVTLNNVDFVIVLLDVVFFLIRTADVELPNVAFLRVLRLLKLSRAFHLLSSQDELYIFLQGFVGSLKATLFGCIFLLVALVIFGIIAVELLHPFAVDFAPTCSVCPDAFDSVYHAILALVETVIVGDTWGELFVPYLKKSPATLLYIFPVFVVVHLMLMNLIMAVIVENAHQARLHSDRQMAAEKEQDFLRNKTKLYKICATMDTDASGNISLDELHTGYANNPDLQLCMKAMDVQEEDLVTVFNILDEDGSGDVGYKEFVDQLHKMKSSDSHTMLVFIKHFVTDLRRRVAKELAVLNQDVVGGLKTLQTSVLKDMELVREDMSTHHEDMAAILKRLDAIIGKQKNSVIEEEKLSIQQDSLTPMPSSPIVIPKPSVKTNVEVPVIDAQLHVLTEQISIALDDLRNKCEISTALLNTFQGMVPRTATNQTPSFSVSAGKHWQPMCHSNTKTSTATDCQLRFCGDPQLARAKAEIPLHQAS